MSRQRIETGFRTAEIETYKNHLIRVVAGHDGSSDGWRTHVYLVRPNGVPQKINSVQGVADTPEEALNYGFAKAERLLDADADPSAIFL